MVRSLQDITPLLLHYLLAGDARDVSTARTFLDYDLQLRQIAAACKLSLTAKNARDGELARALLQPMVSAEIYASLPAVAQRRLSWSYQRKRA